MYAACAGTSLQKQQHIMHKEYKVNALGTTIDIQVPLPLETSFFDHGQDGVEQELTLRKQQWRTLWIRSNFCRCLFRGHSPVVLARCPFLSEEEQLQHNVVADLELANHKGWTLQSSPPHTYIMGRVVPLTKDEWAGYPCECVAPQLTILVPARYMHWNTKKEKSTKRQHRLKPKHQPLTKMVSCNIEYEFNDAFNVNFRCQHGCELESKTDHTIEVPSMPVITSKAMKSDCEQNRTTMTRHITVDTVRKKSKFWNGFHLANQKGNWGPFRGPSLSRYDGVVLNKNIVSTIKILSAIDKKRDLSLYEYRRLETAYRIENAEVANVIVDDSQIRCSGSEHKESVRTRVIQSGTMKKMMRVLYKSMQEAVQVNCLQPEGFMNTPSGGKNGKQCMDKKDTQKADDSASAKKHHTVSASSTTKSTTPPAAARKEENEKAGGHPVTEKVEKNITSSERTAKWTFGWKACKLLPFYHLSFNLWSPYLSGLHAGLDVREVQHLVYDYIGAPPTPSCSHAVFAGAGNIVQWHCPKRHEMKKNENKESASGDMCALCKRPKKGAGKPEPDSWLLCPVCRFQVCESCTITQGNLQHNMRQVDQKDQSNQTAVDQKEQKQVKENKENHLQSAAAAGAGAGVKETNVRIVQFPVQINYTRDSWCIVKLAIPPGSRVHLPMEKPYIGSRRKCRTEKAVVIDIQAPILDRQVSLISDGYYDAITAVYPGAKTIYTYGDEASPDGFDTTDTLCAKGIHYYEEHNRQSAFAEWIPGFAHLPDNTNYVPDNYDADVNDNSNADVNDNSNADNFPDAADAASIPNSDFTPMEAAGRKT
jgi:hypothetical protein